MLKKPISKRLLILTALVVILVAVPLLVFGLFHRKPAIKTWSIESPQKTYSVMFTGDSASPSWPFTTGVELENRKVVADISKKGVPLIEHAVIYNGDAYDSNFAELYPDSEWISESVLHLWKKHNSQNRRLNSDDISITNKSGQSLKYLYLKAGKMNLFLLFEVPPDSKVNLSVNLEDWEEVIGSEGKLNDDRDLPYRSADFSRTPASSQRHHYSVVIDRNELTITREE